MPEEVLARYLPLYGDRMAVISFLRDKKDKRSSSKKEKTKSTLMKKLRATVSSFKGASSSDDNEDTNSFGSTLRKKLKGNKNAQKTKRKIELSCFHLEGSVYKQVRGNKGGGPKSFEMDKSKKMGQILQLAKNLYFPNGQNKLRGNVNDYSIMLTDTYFQNIDLESTIESYYDRLKMRQLKFNFCTNLIESKDSVEDEELPALKTKTEQNSKEDVEKIPKKPLTNIECKESAVDQYVAEKKTRLLAASKKH